MSFLFLAWHDAGAPTAGVSQGKILDAMRHDKKFVGGKNRFVLARRIGSVAVIQGISMDLIEEALRKYHT